MNAIPSQGIDAVSLVPESESERVQARYIERLKATQGPTGKKAVAHQARPRLVGRAHARAWFSVEGLWFRD